MEDEVIFSNPASFRGIYQLNCARTGIIRIEDNTLSVV